MPPTPERREHGCFRGGCLGFLVGVVVPPSAYLVAAALHPEDVEPMGVVITVPLLAALGGPAGVLVGAFLGTIEHLLRRLWTRKPK